jgi:hypothetical protein
MIQSPIDTIIQLHDAALELRPFYERAQQLLTQQLGSMSIEGLRTETQECKENNMLVGWLMNFLPDQDGSGDFLAKDEAEYYALKSTLVTKTLPKNDTVYQHPIDKVSPAFIIGSKRGEDIAKRHTTELLLWEPRSIDERYRVPRGKTGWFSKVNVLTYDFLIADATSWVRGNGDKDEIRTNYDREKDRITLSKWSGSRIAINPYRYSSLKSFKVI